MNATFAHLQAFSSLLARDHDAGQLHTRHVQIVCLLCAQGGPLSVGAIAALSGISTSQVSRITDRLAERGLVSKRRDEIKGQTVVIAPTATGRALDERVRASFRAATAA